MAALVAAIHDFTVEVAIREELGKVDINQASETLLANLFAALDVPRQTAGQLADAIADWRDTDDSKRLNGAERNEYAANGLDYGPRNAAFETVEELQLVLGMTRDIFTAARPYFTVYSQRSRINALTASTPARAALGGVMQFSERGDTATTDQLNNMGGQSFSMSAQTMDSASFSYASRVTMRFMGWQVIVVQERGP